MRDYPDYSCFVTPEHTWTRYGSAIEPGSQMERNPDCPAHPPEVVERRQPWMWPYDHFVELRYELWPEPWWTVAFNVTEDFWDALMDMNWALGLELSDVSA